MDKYLIRRIIFFAVLFIIGILAFAYQFTHPGMDWILDFTISYIGVLGVCGSTLGLALEFHLRTKEKETAKGNEKPNQ